MKINCTRSQKIALAATLFTVGAVITGIALAAMLGRRGPLAKLMKRDVHQKEFWVDGKHTTVDHCLKTFRQQQPSTALTKHHFEFLRTQTTFYDTIEVQHLFRQTIIQYAPSSPALYSIFGAGLTTTAVAGAIGGYAARRA